MMAGGLSGEAPKQVTTTGSGPVSEPSSEKVLGPGPKPIEEVARSHGGDAGKAGSMSSRAKDEDDNSSSSSLSSEDEGDIKNKSQEEIEEAGRRREQRKKNKKGTGQIYIKSTGLQADGGDFDAARAGAGREAERTFITGHACIVVVFTKY